MPDNLEEIRRLLSGQPDYPTREFTPFRIPTLLKHGPKFFTFSGEDTGPVERLQYGPLRDRALLSILTQLSGKGDLTNVREAGLLDTLASSLRETEQGRRASLVKRGLSQSGAATLTGRNLAREYASDIGTAVSQTSQAESRRKQSLLAALLGIGQTDIATEDQRFQAILEEQGASQEADIEEFNRILGGVRSGVGLGLTALGGYLGASGGGSLTGALSGAAAGQSLGQGQIPSQFQYNLGQNRQQQPLSMDLGPSQQTGLGPSGGYRLNYDPSVYNLYRGGF